MTDKSKYHKAVIEEFSSFSDYYDEYVGHGKTMNNTSMEYNAVSGLITLMGENLVLDENMSVLDLGTGTGLFAEALKNIESSVAVTGLDLTIGMLEQAKEKKILDQMLCADLTQDFPFSEDCFDMTAISSVFEFLEGFYQHTIDEMLRVTKPNGILALSAIKSDELHLGGYLEKYAQIIAYKEAPGYIVTKSGNSESTPYEFILAQRHPS